MKLTLYQVDAFTDHLFGGNPAAVIPLKKWLPEELMQKIAMENNLAETVYFVPSSNKDADYDIRWFTPVLEINLCGHATLASAFVIFQILKAKKKKVVFNSKSGLLTVRKKKETILLDFPSWKPEKIESYPQELQEALGGQEIVAVYKNRDLLVELMHEDAVRNARPDFTMLKRLGEKVIITAPGQSVDFVSRFFAPTAGIDEDPVTGSAHSQLIPFWSEKLGKTKMEAKQLSARGGDLLCELVGDRVIMGGKAVYYMKATIEI
jgi:PhzF family phenazine biosynthesis protein